MEKLIHETFNCALGDTGEYEGHSVIRTENGDVWYADMPDPNDLEVEGHAEIVRRVNKHDSLVAELERLMDVVCEQDRRSIEDILSNVASEGQPGGKP